jgi:hypothetical protein
MFLEEEVCEDVNWSCRPHRRVQVRNPVRINLRVPEKVWKFLNFLKLALLHRLLAVYRT